MFKTFITILIVAFCICSSATLKAQTNFNSSMLSYAAYGYSFGQDPKVKILKFFPVPARDFITFEFVTAYQRGLSFEIITQIGNKLVSAQNVVSRFTLNTTTYKRGIYFYVLKDRNGKSIETGKFQVIK